MTLSALVGAGTVTGCSSLPVPAWFSGGPAGITGMLDRLESESDDRFLSTIAPVGDDLVLTMEEDTSHVDTDASTMEHFEHLPTLLEALELEDAHLMSAYRNRVEEGPRAHAPEWVWATRFDSPEEHTSLGAIHVDGDSADYARQMLDEEETHYREGRAVRPRIVDAELDGQIIRVTFANDPATDSSEASEVGYLHGHFTAGGPSWTPLGY